MIQVNGANGQTTAEALVKLLEAISVHGIDRETGIAAIDALAEASQTSLTMNHCTIYGDERSEQAFDNLKAMAELGADPEPTGKPGCDQ